MNETGDVVPADFVQLLKPGDILPALKYKSKSKKSKSKKSKSRGLVGSVDLINRRRKRVARRVKWIPMEQGAKGFNQHATNYMVESGLTKLANFTIECKNPKKLHAYQMVSQFMVSPETTVDRLVVVNRVGSGKTWVMISILNNYHLDKRPKIVIFPEKSIARHFLTDLLSDSDNYYQRYVRAKIGKKNICKVGLQ